MLSPSGVPSCSAQVLAPHNCFVRGIALVLTAPHSRSMPGTALVLGAKYNVNVEGRDCAWFNRRWAVNLALSRVRSPLLLSVQGMNLILREDSHKS